MGLVGVMIQKLENIAYPTHAKLICPSFVQEVPYFPPILL